MKKALLIAGFAGVLLGAAALVAVAQDQQSSGRRGSRNREGRGGGPRPEFTDPLAEVRGEDGSLNLEGLMTKLSEGLKAADKDADGVLTAEELRESDFGRFFLRGPFGGPGGPFGGPGGPGGPRPDGQRGPGGPDGQRGPGGPGGMMGGPMRYMFQAMVVDLSKLPEDTPDDVRETFTKADKNSDGILDSEERMAMMPRPGGAPGPGGPDGNNARPGRRGSRNRGN
ncbi:MAG: hypothetical protein IJH68_06180 [Thermoguttaceae bacterium]|nr:hypothetical protein [Thermoguttaceae bacterium]MBQ6619720.1 hypothetical protein [Thermoguttaceae bacterium]